MYDTFTKVYNLTSPIEKKIAKSVARGNRKAVLRWSIGHVFRHVRVGVVC